MSNALAIASVTRLLKDLLNDTLVNGDISGDIGTDVIVTALPPDRVLERMNEQTPSQLNLYLHRITPNAAISTSDLPTRDARGAIVHRPRLALDLHYLLTAYTNQELHGEILLGYAMEMFHETPVLARNMVRAALQGGVNGTILPPAFQTTDPARLADQIELIKINPQTLSMDDMSKLWTAFQTNYRTTVAYLVSVVLIERDQPARTPLPVLSRGPVDMTTGRDACVVVNSDLLPPTPTLTELQAPARRPAIRLGDTLTLTGHRLDAGEARIRFTEPETGGSIDLTPAAAPTPDRMMADLPSGPPLAANHPLAGTGSDPGAWRIGTYLVDVALTRAGAPERITNRLPIALAPRATPSAAAVPAGTRVTVTCEPRIRARQPLSLIVGQAEAPIEPLVADADQVSAVFPGLQAGARLPIRLRVAGIDSLLIDPEPTPPRFDPTQFVLVP
jgi:Pvc16 N-terminal domain